MFDWQNVENLNLGGHYHFVTAIVLMMLGFYVVLVSNHLVKKLIGLGIFQTSALLLYISAAWVEGSVAPILTGNPLTTYTNPLPHVLMLTAIVVGVAVLAVGLAIAVRIRAAYGTVEEDRLVEMDNADSERIDAYLREWLTYKGEGSV